MHCQDTGHRAAMSAPSVHRAFLIDLDGVVYVQERLIDGALDTLRLLRERGIPHRFVTNTTGICRRMLRERLRGAGLEIPPDHLFTAPIATAQYLRGLRTARCFFYVRPEILEDFDGIERTSEQPTHVVIGDVGREFNYDNLNRVFRMIRDGGEIIAFQKNRYWLTTDGLVMDAGAFIAALEFATGQTARVFGKPSRRFFEEACASLRLPPERVTMIGDDFTVDIAGAAAAGLQTVFVRTGKDKDRELQGEDVRPNAVLPSIAEVQRLL
jgi:HAD superfamily hydrolase (TIGR01458 family)